MCVRCVELKESLIKEMWLSMQRDRVLAFAGLDVEWFSRRFVSDSLEMGAGST